MAEALGFSALTKILSTAVGLVCNTPYDGVTNQLKDGDVAKESVHEMIVRDLTDIKSKLDCLSLKDLDASYSFLKEGVQLLNLAIDSSSKESRRFSKESASDILKEASSLRKAIRGLNISSETRFLSAKDRFRASRERATDAFNNKSLNSTSRVMACKLRVAATILECGLKDPQVAVTACLVSLQELHGLPQVQDMLSVFLKGGFKSWLKSEERLDNIMSVLCINHALFDFASKHSSEYPNVFTWPEIQLEDSKVNPILHANEILEKTSRRKEFSPQLSIIVISERKLFFFDFAIKSRSEVVQINFDDFIVIKNTGERKVVSFPFITSSIFVKGIIIAVDCNDLVYAVRFVRARDGTSIKDNLVLYVFDENYDIKHETTLDFLHAKPHVKIAVDKNKDIIMIQKGDNHVYICNSKGQLKLQFERESSQAYSLSTTSNNDIMIPSDDQCSVHIYTPEGALKCTIKTPEGRKICKVAFHHGICKVIVLTCELKYSSLLCYSETGELEHAEIFNDQHLFRRFETFDIAGHCSGPFAIQWWDSINFI